MVHAQIKRISRRVHCVSCNRKRLLKFMNRIRLPFNGNVIEVCEDCFAKYSSKISIERRAGEAE